MRSSIRPHSLAVTLKDRVLMESDRSSYFDAFFEKVKDAEWTCFASQQLLGVYDFLEEVYLSDESKLNYQGYGNIQDAVIIGGEDPDDYVSGLTELINQYHDDMVKLCQ